MAPVTEVVLLTLVPNADYAAITESAKILARQPGCLAVRTSRLHDARDKVHYFIDWDSVASHLAFARNGDVYAPFRALVGSVMAAYAPPYHVALAPYPPAVFGGDGDGGRAVMVGKAWFPAARTDGVAEAFAAFVGVLGERGRALGFAGRAAGDWALEEEILYKEVKSRVFLFVVAWEGVEAYVRFRGSEEFKSLLAPIAGLRGLRELDICLVDLRDADA
ncbi:hypothetical protein ANO14919_039300 [Xylariales sp. No.14919]|nr:hypothetical protein ANO14919_039300 [Xylariales sp. No.14919]